MPYPCGLIHMDIDTEALDNLRVVVKSVSAILPGGSEISMPGNAVIPPLDLAGKIQTMQESFMVYLALPFYSENSGNLCESESSAEKRMNIPEEEKIRDENTGGSEIAMVLSRLNVRLTTDMDDNTELDMLPILRLRVQTRDTAETTLEIDRNFVPPYAVMDASCPLFSRLLELNIQMKRRRDKLLTDLTALGYSPEMFSGCTGHSILQLAMLNRYIGRFSSLFNPGRSTPFEIYLELRSFLGELAALQPLRDLETVAEYNHFNFAPQYNELLMNIRALLLADGETGFVRLNFEADQEKRYLQLHLEDKHIFQADEYYLAVQCEADAKTIVGAVEKGNNFRLVSPQFFDKRVRGVKLTEMRYPPRFFPALPNTVWFKLEREDSAEVWRDVCEKRIVVLDWSRTVFPNLEASLFIILSGEGGGLK